ncbi:TolB family protein [Lacunimicrobium album]
MNVFWNACVVLGVAVIGSRAVMAQDVVLPKDGYVTAEWTETLPEGAFPICVVPTDFSKPPRLLIQDLEYVTTKSRHGSPAWSKDGSKIAFDCQPADGDLNKGRIITCNVDGTDVRDVGLGLMPNWSPAGTRLAFSTYEAPGYVCTINADGTDRQVIPGAENGWGTQWSPDGLSIAYYLWRDGCELMVYDLVKKEARSIIPAEDNPYRQIYWNFAWSPDSQKIAICGVRKSDGLKETALVNVTPGNYERQVLTSFYRDSYYLDYHPDGNQLVYGEAGCIMSFDLTKQDATPQLLQGQSPDFGYSNPAVSPNGKWIAVGLR